MKFLSLLVIAFSFNNLLADGREGLIKCYDENKKSIFLISSNGNFSMHHSVYGFDGYISYSSQRPAEIKKDMSTYTLKGLNPEYSMDGEVYVYFSAKTILLKRKGYSEMSFETLVVECDSIEVIEDK